MEDEEEETDEEFLKKVKERMDKRLGYVEKLKEKVLNRGDTNTAVCGCGRPR